MKISTKGRYAIRFMVDLSEHCSDSPVKIKDIAKRQALSEKYLEQIASILNKADMIRSIRGPQGGYMVNVDPSECTVGAILRLTESKTAIVNCLEETPTCNRMDVCKTRKVWQKLDTVIADLADNITIKDIIEDTIDEKCELL